MTAVQTKPIWDNPAGIWGRSCKTNPIRTVGRRNPEASGTNEANPQTDSQGPGSARRAMLPVGPLVRNEANSGQCRAGWGWGPARRFSSRPSPPVASGLFRCRPYKQSQSPAASDGTRPFSVGTNKANFRLDGYGPRPAKTPNAGKRLGNSETPGGVTTSAGPSVRNEANRLPAASPHCCGPGGPDRLSLADRSKPSTLCLATTGTVKEQPGP